jgi:hypothetical protein
MIFSNRIFFEHGFDYLRRVLNALSVTKNLDAMCGRCRTRRLRLRNEKARVGSAPASGAANDALVVGVAA